MHIEIACTQARDRFADGVHAVMAKLAAGKSIHRGAAPDALTWAIEWGIRVSGGSFRVEDVLSGRALEETERFKAEQDAMTFEQRLDARLAQVAGLVLVGRIGRFRASAPLAEVPDEVRERIAADLRATMAEEARIAALSPEERAAKAEAALRELRKDPGFLEIRVPVRRGTL